MQTKERPILFSGPMVRAILDGRKTVTRRVIKPQPPDGWAPTVGDYNPTMIDTQGEEYTGDEVFGASDEDFGVKCPYGRPGDRLWVRSRWSVTYQEDRNQAWWCGPDESGLSFVTHGRPQTPKRFGNQPSIHLPRWVAQNLRLPVLEVVDVRAERVREITGRDAAKEGLKWDPVPGCGDNDQWCHGTCKRHGRCQYVRPPVHGFRELWDKLNASRGYSWESNPWVWRVEFRQLTEDQPE